MGGISENVDLLGILSDTDEDADIGPASQVDLMFNLEDVKDANDLLGLDFSSGQGDYGEKAGSTAENSEVVGKPCEVFRMDDEEMDSAEDDFCPAFLEFHCNAQTAKISCVLDSFTEKQ